MLEFWALGLPLICLLAYVICSSIQLGASIIQFRPRLVGHRQAWRTYLSPTWELTNALIAGSVLLLIFLYPGTVPYLRRGLGDVLVIGATLLVARALLQAMIYYRNIPAGPRPANGLLVVLSLAVPAVLSQAVIVFLGGSLVTDTAASTSVGLTAVIASTALSLSFYAAVAPAHGLLARRRLSDFRHKLVMLLAGLFTLVLPPMLGSLRPGLVSQDLVIVIFVVTVALGLGYLLAEHIKHSLIQFAILSGYVLLVIALFTSQHLPYIFYPNVTLESAFTTSHSFYLLLAVLLPGLIAILVSLGWLHHQTITSLDDD